MRNDDAIARVGVDDVAPWTLTHTGRKMYYLTPTVEMFDLDDIVVHLGNLCRFTGATSQFYSVAQHSVLVMALVKRKLDVEGVDRDVDYWNQILAAALHDAEEAYVNDLASPLKAAIRGKYVWIANGIRNTIFEKFGVDREFMNPMVKEADNDAVLIERYYLMPAHPDWPGATKAEIDFQGFQKPSFQNPHEASMILKKVINEAIRQRDAL